MARIYYTEEKLSGKPVERNLINVELFDFIFNNTNANKFELQDIQNSSFFGLIKSKTEIFKNVQLTRDGMHYHATEGSFFLPASIIFYDVFDYNFPSEFYFIAKVGSQIEIRKCNGGADVKWFQIPALHKPVNDSNILTKIEHTLSEVKKLVETTYNKQIEEQREKKELEERQAFEANRPDLDNVQKNAYRKLTELCVHNKSNQEEILKFIDTLKNYDNDSVYYTTLNCFMTFLDEAQFNFIMRMDWKASIEDLEWLLQNNLKDNYNLMLNLPGSENYDELASVSCDSVFEDFDRPLRENELQLGFIDTQCDEYIVIVHKIQDKEKVEELINRIGYDYQFLKN